MPEDDPPAYSQAIQTTSSGSSPRRVVPPPRRRQEVAPFRPPVNGLQMYTKQEAIRGDFNKYWHRELSGAQYQIGSWSLDPMAPQVPAQDLVQMVLDGQGEKKRRCGYRLSKKKVPLTAMLRSRHGSIHATFRVDGESALRSVATIRSDTRRGNIFLDVVSL